MNTIPNSVLKCLSKVNRFVELAREEELVQVFVIVPDFDFTRIQFKRRKQLLEFVENLYEEVLKLNKDLL